MKNFLTNRWSHFVLLFSLLFVFVFVVPTDSLLRQRVQFLTFDYYLTNFQRVPEKTVKIIDIDDESLSRTAQWPWPRTIVAEMVEKLTEMGALVIAFDGVLAEPDRTSPSLWPRYADTPALKQALESFAGNLTDNDRILAEAIKKSGIFVAGFSFGSNREAPRIAQEIIAPPKIRETIIGHTPKFQHTARFLPELEAAATGNGSFMASAEIDGVIRRTPLIFTDGKLLYPSLGVEALRVSFAKRPIPKIGPNRNFSENSVDTEYRLIVGSYEVPIEKDGRMWVHFRKMDKGRDYVPAWKLFDPAHAEMVKEQVKGQIVFIGSSAEGLLDLRSTPLGLIPGVEVHVNSLEQILDGNYLIRPDIVKDAENNFILIIGLILIMLAPFIGASWLALICFALSGGVFYLSYLSFVKYGVLIDPLYPVMAALLIYIMSSILTYIRTEAERRQVRQAFGLYISPDFMAELTKNPDKLKLGGETRELSVMFTDIRSFTTISESMSPEALIQLMNDFLTPMSDQVMATRGTIDKYMGDAMMAFWNAPLDDEHHARHACRAALRMNETLKPINEQIRLRAENEGRKPVLLQAGIGVNTGPASVGNMGSKQRFAYSALGDTVNLASRLEGQTKAYGVHILISEATRVKAQEFAALELDLIQVKGKTEPVRIYTLLGEEDVAQSQIFRKWQVAHYEMLSAYRALRLDDALSHIENCRELSGGQISGYYDVFAARIAEMKAAPPAKGWNGVYVATSK